jgi:tRNA (adenine57-N1/adenine58-N1)-methyltransferase
MKLLISKEKNEVFYWKQGDFHSLLGTVKEAEIKNKESGIVKTHIGKELFVLPASFTDKLNKISRGPAVPTLKDIGVILSNIPLHECNNILDAGTGCGIFSSFFKLYNPNAKITTYERNEEFMNTAKKNYEFLGVKDINVINKDIYEGIEEGNFDLCTLDLLEPARVVPNLEKVLHPGSYLVCFMSNLTQVQELIKATNNNYFHIKTIEVLEREWTIEALRLRPNHQMLGHSAFISFLRKL